MKKRLLSCNASDFANMTKDELKNAIKASEGRTVLSENIVAYEPFCRDITNSELARSFGADLILLNCLDVFNVDIKGLPQTDEPIKLLKKYVGRPVGVNLEPVDLNSKMLESVTEVSNGRKASKETLIRANELGFDFICLTGNPGTGVTNNEIIKAISLAKENFNGLIIAGKMHGAGVDEDVIDFESVEKMIDAGIDILLVPSAGTIPGLSVEEVRKITKYAHKRDVLVMSAIGTSQESATKETIRQIAIMNKMAGVDIQHIGDGSSSGVAPYGNIFELSIAIRGARHTIRMIASSVHR